MPGMLDAESSVSVVFSPGLSSGLAVMSVNEEGKGEKGTDDLVTVSAFFAKLAGRGVGQSDSDSASDADPLALASRLRRWE